MITLQHRKSGFTIVELMVVIVVIAILATIGLIGYDGIQKSARDKDRESDIELIQASLETFYSQKGYYPSTNSSPGNIADLMERSLLLSSTSHKSPDTPKSNATSVQINLADPASPSNYSYYPEGCVVNQCQKYRLKWKSEKTDAVTTIQSRYGW